MIFALIGNDGTGKSTLSRLTYKELKRQGVDVEYRRGFKHFLVQIFLELLGRKGEYMRETFMTRTIRKPSYYKLWPYMVWIDCILRLVSLKIFKRSQIVIFDRYTLDFLVSWEYFGYSNDLLRKLYLLFPKPELAFVLDAPAEITFKRSKFDHKFPLYFYRVQRERYLALAKALKIRVIVTTKTIDETLKEILDEIKRVMLSSACVAEVMRDQVGEAYALNNLKSQHSWFLKKLTHECQWEPSV